MRKRKKRTLICMALMMALSLVLSTVTSFGVATADLKPIEEGGSGVSLYRTNVNGDHARWNAAANAIEIDKDYTNRLIRTSSNKSTLEEHSGLRSSRNIVFSNAGGTYTMNTDLQFVFDVTDYNGEKNGAIKIKYTGYKIADPLHAKADGEGYVWVDVVLTVTNWTKKASGIYNNNASAFSIGRALTGGYPAIRMCNIGELRVKYDYFIKGTDTQYKLKTNATYRDIDAQQGIAFQSGTFERVAVTPNTNMMYGENDTWHVFTSSGVESESDNSRNALGLAYDADGSRMTYISNQHDITKNPTYGEPGGYWTYFAPDTYSWFDPELNNPIKNVSDKDEKDVKQNTILQGQPQTWWYKVIQHIPAGMQSAFYFDEFVMTDKIDECLDVTVDNVQITSRENPGSNDVTNQFNITVSNDNVVTATAKSAFLNNADFYGGVQGNAITMKITVTPKANFADIKEAHGHVISDTRDEVKNGTEKTTYTVIDGEKLDANEVVTVLTTTPTPPPGEEPDPEPVPPAAKSVSDADEEGETENWLSTPDETFTYSIDHRLPAIFAPIDPDTGEEGDMPYFQSYEFTDTLEDILKPVSAKVLSNGTDISSDFHISINGQKVTATMTQPALVTDDSYGRDYTLQIETEMDG